MSIKVFCAQPQFLGYQTNPADVFLITVGYEIFEDTGGDNNGPRSSPQMSTLYMPVGSTPLDVYETLYTDILAACVAESYSTPAKSDIYGFTPMPFSTLIPD